MPRRRLTRTLSHATIHEHAAVVVLSAGHAATLILLAGKHAKVGQLLAHVHVNLRRPLRLMN